MDPFRFQLLRPQRERCQDLPIKAWIDVERKTSEAGDRAIANVQVFRAWSACEKVFAKRLQLLN